MKESRYPTPIVLGLERTGVMDGSNFGRLFGRLFGSKML